MQTSTKAIVTSVYLVLLLGLGTTDALFTKSQQTMPGSNGASSSSQGTDPTLPGIDKQTGADIFDVFNGQSITTDTTREESLLQKIVPSTETLQSRVILKGNDRLAYIAWLDSPEAKTYFTALKDALTSSFSSQMKDLVDEVQDRDGHPTRDVLSFFDPSIHSERLLFVRVRQRLFEFHVAPGREPDIQALMDGLTE